MLSAIVNACKSFFNHVKETIKNFTKPKTAVLAAGTVSDIKRSRKDLIVENAILRQQLIVLNRQVKRPKFSDGDRLRLVFLSRLTQFWDSALHLVQPASLPLRVQDSKTRKSPRFYSRASCFAPLAGSTGATGLM